MVSDADVSLADAARFNKSPGGAPANVAIGLRRLGISSAFVGQVGADPFGDWLCEVVRREGVQREYLFQTELARTTVAFVAAREDGKKDICFYRNPGADMLYSPDAIDEKLFDGARIFHCGSLSLSENPCRDAQFKAARMARAKGVLVSYDPNWRPSIWRDFQLAHHLIWEMMALADVVKVAEEEWEFITGTNDFAEGADMIRLCGPKLVVVTCGSDGVYFDYKSGSGKVAGLSVQTVDTLGAGDAFMAGLISQLLESASLAEAMIQDSLKKTLHFANACGALATTKVGAIPALPTRGEVESFLFKL